MLTRKRIVRLNSKALSELAGKACVRGRYRVLELCDDEAEKRAQEEELRDWDEQDRRAAQEELYELWRNEY
jgi:hypothetical protein